MAGGGNEAWAKGLAHDAASLPFGAGGELRRKLVPTVLAVLLLFVGVGYSGFGIVFRTSELHYSRRRESSERSLMS